MGPNATFFLLLALFLAFFLFWSLYLLVRHLRL